MPWQIIGTKISSIGRFCHTKKLVQFEVRFKKPLQKSDFPRGLFAQFEVRFWRCVLRPPPLVVLFAARLPHHRQPLAPLPCVVHPPPLIMLSAAHPLFYLIVVCWIGGDGTWLPIQCLALSTPSLSPCYLLPACFVSCSPATCLPYFLIVMCWLMSLTSRDRHYP